MRTIPSQVQLDIRERKNSVSDSTHYKGFHETYISYIGISINSSIDPARHDP